MKRWLAAAVCLISLGSPAIAAQPYACQPTPKIAAENYPGADRIPPGNDLLLQAGKSIAASGQRLVIHGRVFDSDCMPVAGATVELWQNDPYGKWVLAAPADLATPNPVFSGAGRAITDSSGNFTFITAFPAALQDRAPHFSLRVAAQAIPDFTTQLYFNDDKRNAADPVLKSLSLEARSRVMLAMQPTGEGYLGRIDLVLPGRTPYQRY